MKATRAVLVWMTLVCSGCESSGPARPAASSTRLPPPAKSLAEQARELALASRPGEHHKALLPLAGEWEVSVSDVTGGAEENAAYHGHASLGWVLGERFLRWDATVDFGGTNGTTTGYVGYDLRTAQYLLMMISDLATGMEVARGNGILSGTGILFVLEQLDPATGTALRARSRLRRISDDHFALEQVGEDDRAERVWHYRRVGAPTR